MNKHCRHVSHCIAPSFAQQATTRISLSEAGGFSASKPQLAIEVGYLPRGTGGGYVTITARPPCLLFFDSTRSVGHRDPDRC